MIPEFWTILFAYKRHIFLHPYFGLAVAVGVVAALLADDSILQQRYTMLLGIAASISVSALLGMVLAGLAVVVTLTSDELLAIAARVGRGVVEDYFPFSLAASVAVMTTAVSVLFLIFTPKDDMVAMRIGIGLSMALFVWALLNVLALVRFVAQRGITRAIQASTSESTAANEGEAER